PGEPALVASGRPTLGELERPGKGARDWWWAACPARRSRPPRLVGRRRRLRRGFPGRRVQRRSVAGVTAVRVVRAAGKGSSSVPHIHGSWLVFTPARPTSAPPPGACVSLDSWP